MGRSIEGVGENNTFRLGQMGKAVLLCLAVGSIALAAVMAPNAVQILKPFLKKKKYNKQSLVYSLRRLEEERYVRIVRKEGKEILEITEKGKKRIRVFSLEQLTLTIPPKWDSQWTIILYDIPEKFKKIRDALKDRLKEMGCMRFHKSVFIHPSNCQDEIDYLAETLEVGQFVLTCQTQTLGKGEYRARRYFGFPLQR